MEKKVFKFAKKALEKIHPAEAGQRINVYDSEEHGLALRVTDKGVKSFVFNRTVKNRSERIFLGRFPDMTVEQARNKIVTLRAAASRGENPAVIAREERQQSEPSGVEAVADEWIKRHLDVNVNWPEAKRILKKDIVPPWKHKLITDVSRPDVMRLIDGIVDGGSPVAANRVLAVVKAFFNWTVGRGYIAISPAAAVKPPTVEQSRDRVLTDTELAEILPAVESIEYPNGPFVRMLAMLAQRRGEVASMRWCDVDLDKAMWTLPKEATKAGRIHDVPLSTEAVTILNSIPRFKKGDYVFTTMEGVKPINGFSKMKARIDTAIQNKRTERGIKEPIADWTMHDLRRTAATHMAKANVPPHVLSAILNHTPGSAMGVTSIYNRFRYTDERRSALQAWAEHLTSLTTVKVVAIDRKAKR
jgi:integrase